MKHRMIGVKPEPWISLDAAVHCDCLDLEPKLVERRNDSLRGHSSALHSQYY